MASEDMRFLDSLVKVSSFLESIMELTNLGLVLAKTINAIIKMTHIIITGHIQVETCVFCSFGCSTLVSIVAAQDSYYRRTCFAAVVQGFDCQAQRPNSGNRPHWFR